MAFLSDSRSVMPMAFVLLWSTGFVGGRWGLPYAGPFSLLAVRMVFATLLLASLSLTARAAWPASRRDWIPIVVSGLLIHGIYLGGVFGSIAAGVPTGMTALIVGLQPLLTAALGPLADQPRSTGKQWLALLVGSVGLALVIPFDEPSLAAGGQLVPAIVALIGITAGSLIQKRWVPVLDFRMLAMIQYGASALMFAWLATTQENWRIEWAPPLLGALAWLTLALSVGAIALLYRLIRERSMEEVTSLFYATPAVTALLGFILFDERLSAVQWLGFPIVGAAVWLGTRRGA